MVTNCCLHSWEEMSCWATSSGCYPQTTLLLEGQSWSHTHHAENRAEVLTSSKGSYHRHLNPFPGWGHSSHTGLLGVIQTKQLSLNTSFSFSFHLCFLNIFSEAQLLYDVVLVSDLQQSECLYISPLFCSFFPFKSPQSTKYGCLCYTAGSH